MNKQQFGNLVILGLVALNFILWLAFPPIDDGRPNFLRAYAGEVLGATVVILMACGLMLAARPQWSEPYFGGLDKMYAAHKRLNTAAFLLLFIHLLTVPITTDRLLPGTPLAIIAFLSLVTLVLLTLSPRIPILSKLTNASYDRWKRTHRFIGIFYALGFVHSLWVDGLSALVAFSYVQFIFLIGLAAYLYTEVFSRFLNKSLPYTVSAVRHLNGGTTEVTLSPKGQKLRHQPGQFLFVRFSIEQGSLTVEEVAQNAGNLREREIYLCGPLGMVQAFAEKFKAQGVPAGKIHYEEFNFR